MGRKVQEKHAGYFEGTLQLRDATKEHLNFVVEKTAKDGRAKIARIKKVRGGYDLQFSSNKYLRRLGKLLAQKYPGEVKEAAKLYTRNRLTQKEVFRLNVLFRPLPFKKGDAVLYRGEPHQIMAVGKQIFAKHSKTGKKVHIKIEGHRSIRHQ